MPTFESQKVRDEGRLFEASKRDRDATIMQGFSYSIIAEAPPDRRGASRQRLRFRSGKLIDAAGRFLSECRIADRGLSGCGLALRTGLPLPRRLRLYDDSTGSLSEAQIIWQKSGAVGVKLLGPAAVSRQIRATLGASLYALIN